MSNSHSAAGSRVSRTADFGGLRVLSLESRRATEVATLIRTYGGVALTAPATIRARKAGLKPLLDISKLEANFPFNGIVTRRSYLKGHEDLMRRFLKAYIEGVALAKKDPVFAKKVLAKYFKNDPRIALVNRITVNPEIRNHGSSGAVTGGPLPVDARSEASRRPSPKPW